MFKVNKYWGGFIGLILIVGGYIVYSITRKKIITIANDYQPDPAKEAEIKKRNLSTYQGKSSLISKFSTLSSLTSNLNLQDFDTGYFPMTTKQEPSTYRFKVEIPATFGPAVRIKNRDKIKSLITRFDAEVAEASEVHKVPRIFIYGVMAVENINGNTSAVSFATTPAYGLMQVKHATAIDSVKAATNLKILTNEQIKYFKSNSTYGFSSGGSIKLAVKNLLNSEISINVACVELSILISKFGLDDPHKIMVSYNQGRGRLANDGKTRLEIDDMIDYYLNTSHKEGANYLMRTLGKDGSFDILFNDLKVQD